MIGAVIGGGAAIVVAIVGGIHKDVPAQAPGPAILAPTLSASAPPEPNGSIPSAPPEPNGSIEGVTVSQDGTEVTVTGQTSAGVVAVLVGPRPQELGGYWASGVDVTRPVRANGTNASGASELPWSVVVKTDPHVPNNYTVKAFYDSNGPYFPGLAGPSSSDIEETISKAATCGDKCLGPPSIYRGTVSPP